MAEFGWTSSGLLAADAVISAGPCKLGGALVVSDGTNAVLLEIWDSPNSTTTSDIRLGEVSIGASPAAGALTQQVWFGDKGVTALKGLWADVTQTTGTIKFYVFYA